MRGPLLLPSRWAPQGVPAAISRSDRFDRTSLRVLADIERRWPGELDHIDLAVEEVPILPRDWAGDQVPLAALNPTARGRARLVVFRRPIEQRSQDHHDVAALVLQVMCAQLAPVLGVRPEEVHPGAVAE